MPNEAQSVEDFQHLHNDGLKNLEIEKGRLAEARRIPNHDLGQLDDELDQSLTNARNVLSEKLAGGPERVFEHAMGLLSDIDKKRFIIENVLESLKRGEKFGVVLERYKTLGLVTSKADATSAQQPQDNPLATTEALLNRKNILSRVSTAIMQIGVNALSTVPKWVEIEPHITIAPIPSLSFTLKGKGMSVYELFEALRRPEPQPSR
jgi:hypothetical protein